MTDIIWPESLGKPLRSGYSYTLGSAENSSAVVGPSRSRNQRSKHNTLFSCSYLWTDQQLARFKRFCVADTHYMQSWFKQSLKLGADRVEQTVRLFEVQQANREGIYWKVSLKLECPNRFVIDDDTASIIMNWGGLEIAAIVKAASRYHATINTRLPRILQ